MAACEVKGADVPDLATGFVSDTGALAEAIRRAGDADAASLPLLEGPARARLAVKARSPAFRSARP